MYVTLDTKDSLVMNIVCHYLERLVFYFPLTTQRNNQWRHSRTGTWNGVLIGVTGFPKRFKRFFFGCPSIARTLYKIDDCVMDTLYTNKIEDIAKTELSTFWHYLIFIIISPIIQSYTTRYVVSLKRILLKKCYKNLQEYSLLTNYSLDNLQKEKMFLISFC